MKKDKPRWKDLPVYERAVRIGKRNGAPDWLMDHLRERAKQKEEAKRNG